jgi:hypothetical protein
VVTVRTSTFAAGDGKADEVPFAARRIEAGADLGVEVGTDDPGLGDGGVHSGGGRHQIAIPLERLADQCVEPGVGK